MDASRVVKVVSINHHQSTRRPKWKKVGPLAWLVGSDVKDTIHAEWGKVRSMGCRKCVVAK